MSVGPPRCRLAAGRPVDLPPLVLAADGGTPRRRTTVRLLDDGERLSVLFDADDPDPWATITTTDGDLWTEEVVELFVAPGAADPKRYFELQINPLGATFSAEVRSPRGDRRGLRVDRNWRCDGLVAATELRSGGWRARLELPWRSLSPVEPAPSAWRLNLFRIERPRPGTAEFSAWSPTGVEPPDFHRPHRFGFVERVG